MVSCPDRRADRGGYKIGPTISVLNESSRSDFDSRIEPVVEELEPPAYRHAYAAVLSGGDVTVTQAKAPPKSPPVGWWKVSTAPRTCSP